MKSNSGSKSLFKITNWNTTWITSWAPKPTDMNFTWKWLQLNEKNINFNMQTHLLYTQRKRTMSHKYMNSIKCVEQWAKWESGFFLKTIKRKVLYSKSELSCIFRGTKQILLKNSLTDTQILKPQPFYSEHDLSVIFLKMPFFYFFCGKRNKNSNPYVMINDY